MLRETSAFVFASGAATRLGPIAAATPKPLLTFGGKPYLQYLVDWLLASDIDDVVVTAYTHASQIEAFVAATYDDRVRVVREAELVSTARSASSCLAYVKHQTSLLLTADNIWDVDLENLVAAHRDHQGLATAMVTGRSGVPNAGYVRVSSDDDTVLRMWPGHDTPKEDEPYRPASTMGLYVVERDALLVQIQSDDTSIEREPLNRLMPQVTAYWNEGFFFDFGTPDNFQYLQEHPELITQYLHHKTVPRSNT